MQKGARHLLYAIQTQFSAQSRKDDSVYHAFTITTPKRSKANPNPTNKLVMHAITRDLQKRQAPLLSGASSFHSESLTYRPKSGLADLRKLFLSPLERGGPQGRGVLVRSPDCEIESAAHLNLFPPASWGQTQRMVEAGEQANTLVWYTLVWYTPVW